MQSKNQATKYWKNFDADTKFEITRINGRWKNLSWGWSLRDESTITPTVKMKMFLYTLFSCSIVF